jgi:hypothetical protein
MTGEKEKNQMNTTITIAAWLAVALSAFGVIGTPFLIGQPRKPLTAGNYLFVLLQCAIMILLGGYALGWW